MSLLSRTILAFAAAALLVVFVAFTAIQNARLTVSTTARVVHTQQVLQQLEAVISDIKDLETTQRGFLLTGSQSQLRIYQQGLQNLPQRMTELETLLADNPRQQQALQQLQTDVTAKIRFSDQAIVLRQKQGLNAAIELLMSEQGMRLMDAIRQRVLKMQEHERELLTQRSADNQRAAEQTIWIVQLGMGLALLIVALAGGLMLRSLRQREALEQQLHQVFDAQNAARSLQQSVLTLGAISEQLVGSASQVATSGLDTAENTREVNQTLQQVASAIEQLGASIREISGNASEAARMARAGVRSASETRVTVQELQETSVEMNQVLRLISSIAQQTKILALNATLEAARAGEAGKGFAAVANEVKELAKETTQAAEEIGRRLQSVREVSQGAREALSSIGTTIESISELQGMIASAVEEQSVVTHQIGRNMGSLTQSMASIQQGMNQVSHAAEDTDAGARQVQQTATEVRQVLLQLQQMISLRTGGTQDD